MWSLLGGPTEALTWMINEVTEDLQTLVSWSNDEGNFRKNVSNDKKFKHWKE